MGQNRIRRILVLDIVMRGILREAEMVKNKIGVMQRKFVKMSVVMRLVILVFFDEDIMLGFFIVRQMWVQQLQMIIKVRALSTRRVIIYSCDKGLSIFMGRQMFIFMQLLMLKMGKRVVVKVKVQFSIMMLVVWQSCILYFSCMVCVMVCYFFRVMVVNVQIDSLLVKIVKKLAVLQFVFVCQLMA